MDYSAKNEYYQCENRFWGLPIICHAVVTVVVCRNWSEFSLTS